MAAPAMGHATQFGTGSADPVDEQFEFISCSLGKTATLVESLGMRGTRSHIKESVNQGVYTVDGQVVIEPRPDDLDVWIPRITGAGSVLTEVIPDFFATVDKKSKVFTYTGVKVAKAAFRSSKGGNLAMVLDLMGKTEGAAGAAGSFPAISASLSALQPYIHHQAVLTLGGAATECNSIECVIDNALIGDRTVNSETRTDIPEGDRLVTVSCEIPYSADEVALYEIALAGIAGSVVYTSGAYSLTMTFANLKAASKPIAIPGRNQEIVYQLDLQAFQSGANLEVVIVNDSTP